ncbi:MAG TPA: GNAT family N-acetyltransferase [Methanomicrobiales archaeon]|nr:GNAT family N-acetyltransferase [Methanomicrobiales archaeon]
MEHGRGIPVEGEPGVALHVVTAWDTGEIVALYLSAGWWKEGRDDPSEIGELIRGSLVFVVAVDRASGRAVGMGRAISDGVSDAYIQDLVVLPEYRGRGIGGAILRQVLAACRAKGIGWIALIAEGGSDGFYRPLGFGVDEGDVPMMYRGGEDGA